MINMESFAKRERVRAKKRTKTIGNREARGELRREINHKLTNKNNLKCLLLNILSEIYRLGVVI